VLEIQDVFKTYGIGQGRVEALIDINLTLCEGELFAILGSSGSGKTTLLNMMGGKRQPHLGA
jgi:ABC-type lipoprotein export system ATPase subunit